MSTKLVAVMLLTVMSAVGATPQLFSRVVTRELMLLTVEPKLLKFAMRGYRASDWPLDQQSQEMQRRPVAQDGWAERGVLAEQVRMILGGELGLDQIEDPAALCTGAVDKVARIQRPEIVGPQEAAVRFGLGPGVAAEPQAAPRGAGSLRRGA